jgi:hypothetical protein
MVKLILGHFIDCFNQVVAQSFQNAQTVVELLDDPRANVWEILPELKAVISKNLMQGKFSEV